jgi:hypothetical protein
VVWVRLWSASTALSVSHCTASTVRAGVIPQSLQFHTQITLGDVTSRKSARRRVRVDQRVSVIGVVKLPVFFAYVNVNVRFTLEQATKAQRWSSDIALLFPKPRR